MGKLKPIGSEKLQGMDKINRIMEIARYKEHIPKPINEDSSREYSKTLSNGVDYQIVKEKVGYVIKKSINESEYDYVEPMRNRKYYPSYSQALKRLNLIAKEVNVNEGYEGRVSLFNEGDRDDATRFILKMPTEEQVTPATAPAPAPVPSPEVAPEEEAIPPMEEPSVDDVEDIDITTETEPEEEEVTFKTIQKLTGKLAQKLRVLGQKEDEHMSGDDVKYVINSILSALDLSSLSEDDKDEIMNKFEKDEEMSKSDTDIDITSDEDITEPSSDLESELGEAIDTTAVPEREPKTTKMEEMIEGLFSESKVDKILKKYFKIEENEKELMEQKRQRIEESKKMIKQVKRLSESISQEITSSNLIKENSDIKLIGRTKQKNLLFLVNEEKVRVNPKGQIL